MPPFVPACTNLQAPLNSSSKASTKSSPLSRVGLPMVSSGAETISHCACVSSHRTHNNPTYIQRRQTNRWERSRDRSLVSCLCCNGNISKQSMYWTLPGSLPRQDTRNNHQAIPASGTQPTNQQINPLLVRGPRQGQKKQPVK